jgi:hypothetical protein
MLAKDKMSKYPKSWPEGFPIDKVRIGGIRTYMDEESVDTAYTATLAVGIVGVTPTGHIVEEMCHPAIQPMFVLHVLGCLYITNTKHIWAVTHPESAVSVMIGWDPRHLFRHPHIIGRIHSDWFMPTMQRINDAIDKYLQNINE